MMFGGKSLQSSKRMSTFLVVRACPSTASRRTRIARNLLIDWKTSPPLDLFLANGGSGKQDRPLVRLVYLCLPHQQSPIATDLGYAALARILVRLGESAQNAAGRGPVRSSGLPRSLVVRDGGSVLTSYSLFPQLGIFPVPNTASTRHHVNEAKIRPSHQEQTRRQPLCPSADGSQNRCDFNPDPGGSAPLLENPYRKERRGVARLLRHGVPGIRLDERSCGDRHRRCCAPGRPILPRVSEPPC